MELQKLQRVVVDALEDIKAQDIKVFNTVGQSDMFDRVVVATGNSNRQTRALAWHVVQKVKDAGGAVTSVEGTDPGEWVLVDLGDIVVHLMQPTIRQYYALEEMWGAKPVRLKLAAERRPSLAPSADEAPAQSAAKHAPMAPAKEATANKAPAKTPAKRAAAKSVGATPTRKSSAKSGAGRKTAKRATPVKKVAKQKATKGAAKGARKGATKGATKETSRTAAKSTARNVRTAGGTSRPSAKAVKASRTPAARKRGSASR